MINNENLIRFLQKYSKKALNDDFVSQQNQNTVKLSSFNIDRFHCHATKK